MKKLLLLTFAFCLSTFTFSQQYGWVDISANLPVNADLSNLFFVSDDEGWITSNSHAEIYYTTDGGETFEVQTIQYTCNAIHMLNENEGYAGGASGFIYKTTDGGENWNLFGTMGTTSADISFPPNGETGYCSGINGNIWSIDSTGVTKMNSGVPDNLYSISFPRNSNEGWVCGGSIIRHFINGDWTAADQDYPSGGHNAIYMVDTLNGWTVGDNGIISHTSDGQNWFEQTNPDPQLNTFYNTYFLNTSEGWAVGLSGTLIHTINGGDNWNIEAEGLTIKQLNSVHFTSPTNGYVVGNGKTLLKYTQLTTEENNDATLSSIQINSEELAGFNAATSNYQVELPTGTTIVPTVAVTPSDTNATVVITQATELPGTATLLVTAEDHETQKTYTVEFTVAQNTGWQVLNLESIPGNPDFTDVFFSPPSTVWITTNTTNNIFKTNDGGTSFSTQTTQYGTQAVYAFDSTHACSGGLSGRVYYTSDGGLNWPAIGSISVTLNDLDFASSSQGYACGSSGAVFSIANASVTNLNCPSSSTLRGISAPSVDHVWVCGGNRIYYYNGNTYTSQIAPAGTFNDIHFINNQEGWVVGNVGLIGHTEDGGASWTTQTNPDPQNRSLYGVFFFDSDYGWAVGVDGVILYTSNGGSTWSVVGAGLTTENLASIHFTSATNGYIVGNGKTLLKYTQLSETDSTNTSLSTINIAGISLENFNSDTYEYSVELPTGTTEVPQVTATAAVNGATVNITQANSLPGTATIVVTAKNGETQQTYTIHFSVITGIEGFEQKNEWKIFPNPVSEKLTMDLPESSNSYQLKMVNSTGQIVLLKESFSGNEIDVSGLTTGIYFLTLQNSKDIYSARFVKN